MLKEFVAMFRIRPMPKTSAAALICAIALANAARADDVFDGSVELINKSKAPVVAVIDSGSRGQGANVKKWPAIGNKLGLIVQAEKADTISMCFKVGDEITVHVYEVSDAQPTKEVSSKKFPSVIVGLPPDITKNFHIEWDGNMMSKK
jgi:hypothetical protein